MRLVSRALYSCCFALLLAGCSRSPERAVDIDVVGDESALFETGARLSDAGRLVRSATSEGIVSLDEQGRVIPGLADRWIVTDDGLSYIFRLRDGLWLDGAPITGENVRPALRQALAALSGAPLGQEFAAVVDIRAMTGRVVEIRLSHPVPDLLQLLAQPELGLQRKGRGDGPMLLKREGPLALLTPIPPARLGLPQDRQWEHGARPIRLHAVPADLAVRRFSEGDVDLVLGGRFENLSLAGGVAGLSRRALKLDPVSGLFGLAVVRPTGPLARADLREAVAMAIDRESLSAALGSGASLPTTRIVGAPMAEDSAAVPERWTDLSLARRRVEGRGRIARWKGSGTAPALRLALPEGPDADQLFARLSADLGAIGLSLKRVASGADADLQMLDIVARYPRPEWYLNQLSCPARRGLCSPAADSLLAAAQPVADPKQRATLLARAEAELTAANVFIPLGTPVRWALVRDSVSGFAPNSVGFHPLPPLARRPE